MKKFLLALLITLSVCSLVFAGGSKEAETVTTEDGLVPINMWYGAAVTEAGPIPEDWVGYDIIRDELGIELTITALPSNDSDQDVRIQAAGAANDLPDVFFVSRPVLENLVKQGLVAAIDEIYDMMPNRTAKYHDAASINHTMFDGENFGMAVPSSTTPIEGLAIRKDWLDNLGLEVPTTLDEFYDVMYAFTYDDPDGNGRDDTWGFGAFVESNTTLKGYPGSRLWPIMGAFDVAGLWSFNESDLGLTIYKDGFYDFVEYFRMMIENGVVDPNWLSYRKDDFRAAWKQGRFGCMYEQWAALGAESNYAPFDTNFPDGEWIIIDPPIGPDGYQSTGALDKTYRIYAVSQKAYDQGKLPAIAKLFEWMGSDEGYYLLGYGVEGVNYVLNENGDPSTEGLGDMSYTGQKGQVYTQLRNLVYTNTAEETRVRFPDYVAATSGKTISPTGFLAAMEQTPWTEAVGSGMMPTPNADVSRFYEQSIAEFLNGTKELTPENWQKFLSDFERVGGAAWNEEGIEYARANNLVVAD